MHYASQPKIQLTLARKLSIAGRTNNEMHITGVVTIVSWHDEDNMETILLIVLMKGRCFGSPTIWG